MQERQRVADFWDEVLSAWEPGTAHLEGVLKTWMESYRGKGDGAVDLAHYPDPYIGDLRGMRAEPRLVLLGLNPGVGYDALQGPEGVWTKRIKNETYSRCFSRSPAEDEKSWRELHQRSSRYWANLERFARRWLDDERANVADVLNFELYPWHSNKVHGVMQPPAQILEDFVWKPIREVDVDLIFAFGAAWFPVCEELGLEQVELFGKGGSPWPTGDSDLWRMGVYSLASGQHVVVSSQAGYAGPPGIERLATMRKVLESLT